eukprot:jgi/Bigna1/85135/estExt_fgenesh1_pg.C_20274
MAAILLGMRTGNSDVVSTKNFQDLYSPRSLLGDRLGENRRLISGRSGDPRKRIFYEQSRDDQQGNWPKCQRPTGRGSRGVWEHIMGSELRDFLEAARLGSYLEAFEQLEIDSLDSLKLNFDSVASSAKMKTGHKLKLHRLLELNTDEKVPKVQRKEKNPASKWDFQLSKILKSTLFGKVKKGLRRKDLVQVAVKITDIVKLRQAETPEDPHQEAAVMKILKCDNEDECHENLLRLLGVVSDDFELWTVLEYASEGELFGHIKKVVSSSPHPRCVIALRLYACFENLSLSQGEGFGDEKSVRTVFRQIACGVQHMHQHHVAHLDLSLENILLSQCPRTNNVVAKICDFGMARQIGANGPSSILDGTDYRPGKEMYMAPEIYRKEKYCPKSADVYSLGVMLFILLTGQPPYTIPETTDKRFSKLASGSIQGIHEVLKTSLKEKIGKISKDAIDVLSYMLCPAMKRYTIKEVLFHPFFREDVSSKPSSPINILDTNRLDVKQVLAAAQIFHKSSSVSIESEQTQTCTMNLNKKAQIAEFSAAYVQAMKEFEGSPDETLVDIFARVAGVSIVKSAEQDNDEKAAKTEASNLISPERKVSATYRTTYSFDDDAPEPVTNKASVRLNSSPGGESSIQFGAQGSTKPGAQEPKKSNIKVHYGPGGKSTIQLGGESPSSENSAATKCIEGKKCKKLGEHIHSQGKLKDVFHRFAGDTASKTITKQSFIDYTTRLQVDITMEEVDKTFDTFVKGDNKDVMNYSAFVRLVSALP